MKIKYKNSSDDYKEFFSFKVNYSKKSKYIMVVAILMLILMAIEQEANGKITSEELLKLIMIDGGLGLLFIIFFNKIMIGLSKLEFKGNLKSNFDLLGEKSLELNDNKLLYKQLIKNEEKEIQIEFYDIKDIVEYKEYIFILTKNKYGYLNFPIIPNSAFESHNMKLDFMNKITKKLENVYRERI
ncbi:hypothetical protein [Clostridium sardiniense]|uniref:hypothetical protein n=1 Tax=Clostridium sardiniense TaxID=29369 RepID=UPI003D350E78